MSFINLFIQLKNLYLSLILNLKLITFSTFNTLKNITRVNQNPNKLNTSSNYIMRDFIFTWKFKSTQISNPFQSEITLKTPSVKPYFDSTLAQNNSTYPYNLSLNTYIQLGLKNF